MTTSSKRFLIVGTGRSGSSLLASILADAGGNFAMQGVRSWDPQKGGYEHPLLHSAQAQRMRIRKIKQSIIPDRLAAYCERRMKSDLTRLFKQAEFAKSTPLIGLVDVIHRLEFQPVVIVNYRAFQDYARSSYLKGSSWDVPRLSDRYVATYTTALLQLELFGGCAIGYEEIVNPEETRWAGVLGELTPLSTETLLECRNQRVKPSIAGRKRAGPILDKSLIDPRVALVHETLSSLKGRVVLPEAERRLSERP